jgi:hypothetical protein
LSEALLFAEHGENMLCTKIDLNVRNNFYTQHVLPRFELVTCNSMNNLSSYCGLVNAKIRSSDKDLPVKNAFVFILSQKTLEEFYLLLILSGRFDSFFKTSSVKISINYCAKDLLIEKF